MPSNVSGQVVCDVDGNQSVTWTFTNNTQQAAVISTAIVNNSLLTSGSINSVNVNMNPLNVPSLGTAVGQTFTALNTLGTLSIRVTWNSPNFEFAVFSDTSVVLGPCVAPTTAAPTTQLANSGRTLLASGSSSAEGSLLLAVSLVGIGTVLLLVRRRHSV